MKKGIICILSLFFVAGCNEYFNEEDLSIAVLEDYQDLLTATTGVYGKLAEAYLDREGIYNPNIKGDDLSNENQIYFDWGSYGSFTCESQQISNTFYEKESYNWQFLYATIASANNILVQQDRILGFNTSSKQILGEVFFLRAYCYFRLTHVYGQIPIIEDIEIDYAKPSASFSEIYDFIEKDLKFAIKYLPANNESARVPFVTPNRGSAKAILAELYLNWGGYPIRDDSKYLSAAQLAEEVIDSADYFGFSLLSDFSYLWDQQHVYNSESVFSLFYNVPANTSAESEINQTYRATILDINSLDSSDYAYYVNNLSNTFFATERKFYDNFPNGHRKEITFFTRNYLSSLDSICIYNKSKCGISIGFRKFFYDPIVQESVFNFEGRSFYSYYLYGNRKIYLYRYAHTLLTYAEASARAGNLNQKALQCINKIRRRSRKLDLEATSSYDINPGISNEEFIDSVLWERAWEFAGEPEGRWFDLVRTGNVENLESFRYENEGGVPEYPIDKQDYYYHPPTSDQWLNTLLN